MRLQCAIHQTDLENWRCRDCYADNVKRYEAASKGMRVTMSMPSALEHEVLVDGILRPYRHGGTYLEWSIPSALEDELEAYIEKRVDEFKASCPCATCTAGRG